MVRLRGFEIPTSATCILREVTDASAHGVLRTQVVRRLLQTAFVRKPSQTGLGLHYTPPLLLWCIYLVDSFGSGFEPKRTRQFLRLPAAVRIVRGRARILQACAQRVAARSVPVQINF